MAGKGPDRNAVAVSDLATAILDPVLRRRAGISIGLVQSWEDIVGARLAATSRPEKIQWPRRLQDDDPFEPAVLIIACEGISALHIQHETGEIISRVNAFLGFSAIGRIRIVQKPIQASDSRKRQQLRALAPEESGRLARVVDGVDDEGLRKSLERLGASVMASKPRKS